MPGSRLVLVVIVVFFAAAALDHLGVGRSILVAAFSIVGGGIVLALALAFGLGARDLARGLAREEAPGRGGGHGDPARLRSPRGACGQRPAHGVEDAALGLDRLEEEVARVGHGGEDARPVRDERRAERVGDGTARRRFERAGEGGDGRFLLVALEEQPVELARGRSSR